MSQQRYKISEIYKLILIWCRKYIIADYNKYGVFEELVSRIRAGDCRFATAAAGGAVPCVRRKLRAWRTVRTLPQSVRGGGGGFGPVFCENRRTGGRSWRKRVCGTGVQPLFRGLFLCPAPCGVREYADVVRMFAAKLLYVMSELWPDRKFGVEVRASILRGADECVLNITVG